MTTNCLSSEQINYIEINTNGRQESNLTMPQAALAAAGVAGAAIDNRQCQKQSNLIQYYLQADGYFKLLTIMRAHARKPNAEHGL